MHGYTSIVAAIEVFAKIDTIKTNVLKKVLLSDSIDVKNYLESVRYIANIFVNMIYAKFRHCYTAHLYLSIFAYLHLCSIFAYFISASNLNVHLIVFLSTSIR